MSKYGAKPQVVDGIRFHSQREATRYQELKLLVKAAEIDGLILQPTYNLFAPLLVQNTVGCAIVGKYVADFLYRDKRTGKIVVEDVKGIRTALYRWKKKHVEAQYGIEIRET